MAVLIRGAKVITQDAKRQILDADLLVEGNRIAEIGKNLKARAEHVLDAKGKLLLPGFVNTHNHLAMSLLRGYADDMELDEWLSNKIWPREAKLKAGDVKAGSELAMLEMIKSGTTCFNDMYFFMGEVAKAAQESGMRAMLSHGMIDLSDEGKRKRELAEGERIIKEWNGKAGGRISCCPGPHAPYTCSDELLLKSKELAEKYNTKIHIHLAETRKEVFDILKAKGKRPAEYLEKLGLLSERIVAAHCVWLTKTECSLLSKRRVSVSHNPVSNMKLAGGGAAPLLELLAAGANISLGTDGSASNNSLSMFESMKFCSLLQKHARWDATAITAQQALDFATIGGARALGINCGSIEKGKLADLILVDAKAPNMMPMHHPVSQIVYSAHAGNVTDAIIDGKLIMRDREILTLDEEKVAEQAQKAAEDLVSR